MFGVEQDLDESDKNPFRYSGEYFDKETGTYYLRARYYTPSTGRFLTEDSARDGNNWYVYCDNNPIRYVDSNGAWKRNVHKDKTEEWAQDSSVGFSKAEAKIIAIACNGFDVTSRSFVLFN